MDQIARAGSVEKLIVKTVAAAREWLRLAGFEYR